MGKRYLEKRKTCYVICSMDCKYMMRKHGVYYFVDDVELATKFKSRNIADEYIKYYQNDVDINALETVVIPLEISYELINESDCDGIYNQRY